MAEEHNGLVATAMGQTKEEIENLIAKTEEKMQIDALNQKLQSETIDITLPSTKESKCLSLILVYAKIADEIIKKIAATQKEITRLILYLFTFSITLPLFYIFTFNTYIFISLKFIPLSPRAPH